MVAAAASLAACSSSPTLSAQVFATVSLGPSRDMASGNNLCTFGSNTEVLHIGNTDGSSIVDGQSQIGVPVHVSCSVTGAFQASLLTELEGQQGGRLTISGNVDGATGGTNVNGDLVSPANGGEFAQMGCVVTYTFDNQAVPVTPPVAKGRIWGHMSCPKMVAMGGQRVMLADGSTVQETCDAEVDFKFENCSQ